MQSAIGSACTEPQGYQRMSSARASRALYPFILLLVLAACDGPGTPTPAPSTATAEPATTTPTATASRPVTPSPEPATGTPAPSATPAPTSYPMQTATPAPYVGPIDADLDFSIGGSGRLALYFPVVGSPRYCDVYENIGVAWYQRRGSGLSAADVCAAQWYNSRNSYEGGMEPGEWMIYWSIFRPDGSLYEDLLRTLPGYETYEGNVIVLNEPDNGVQADLPALQAALELRKVHAIMPEACLVWPNVILGQSIGYLDEALGHLEELGGLGDLCALGVHIYLGDDSSATDRLRQAEQLLEKYGLGIPIDVTEFGVHPSLADPVGTMEQWTYEILRYDRVRYTFGYTIRGCADGAFCWEQGTGRLSDVGRAWIAGIDAWQKGAE